MINRNPAGPCAPPSAYSSVRDTYLAAMRIREGWEAEKQFRTTFERFVFDMGLPPDVAEVRTIEIIRILKAHQYKEQV